MSSRLRTRSVAPVSFFSFQDILMSVTGILILVTLILTLYLNPAGTPALPSVGEQERIQSALTALAEIQANAPPPGAELDTPATAEEVDRLEEDVRHWAQHRTAQSNLWQALVAASTHSSDPAEDLGLRQVQERQQVLEQTLATQRAQEQGLASALQQMERERQALQAKLSTPAQPSPLWLLPETEPTGKQPWLVIVSRTGLTLERFQQPGSRRQITSELVATEWPRQLRLVDPERDYLVFYVRPSGIELFQSCLADARRQRVQVGFDAVEEHRVLHFAAPPTSP